MTLGVMVGKEIVDQFGLSRESPLENRLKLLPQLETIGITSPAAASQHIFNSQRLDKAVFDLAFSMIADAMPLWGDITEESWQKAIDFATGAGMIEDPTKQLSPAESLLWTNEFLSDKFLMRPFDP